MLTLAQITATFTEHLESQFHNPVVLKAEYLGEQDGMTSAQFTYHGGKPEHVFTGQYKFQWDETDERIYVYFW